MIQKRHLLIVDDEKDIRELLKDMLRGEKVHLYEASNGEEALKILNQDVIDLVLTDLAMPKMNGFELLRKMRSEKKTQGVLVLTGHADQSVAQQLKAFGVLDFIRKPFAAKDIRRMVDDYFQTKAS